MRDYLVISFAPVLSHTQVEKLKERVSEAFEWPEDRVVILDQGGTVTSVSLPDKEGD